MQIRFVLVEPAVPANIGAAARAIKTMGFDSLVLVSPCNHLADEAKWLAHGSLDILENAVVCSSLAMALDGSDFVIGTSARKRTIRQNFHSPEAIMAILEDKKENIKSISLVFGREESGLTNAELELCDIVSSIPLHNPFPSLNLSQAVMLYAYVFSKLQQRAESPIADDSHNIFRELTDKAEVLLTATGINRQPALYHNIRERLALVSGRDAGLMLSIIKRLIDIMRINGR